jgi:riboflavin synthase
MRETLERSTIGGLRPGERVNLERAMRVGDRLGGHIVQGHIDAAGAIVSRTPGERWDVVRIGLPERLARYVAEKGSIAVDGVSLTVSAVGADWFEVSLIPTTMELTTLGIRKPGEWVNLEVDVIVKYVERLAQGSER